jgi:hypothetical protein
MNRKIIWTKEMDVKLIDLNPKHSRTELSKIFGVSENTIMNRRKILKLRKDRRTIWNDENEAYLKKHYPNMKAKDISVVLGISKPAIIAKAFILNLSKSTEFKRKVGLEGQFKVGFSPWNKGMKGVCIGGIESQFKKGHLPHNIRKNGDISIRKDKLGKYHEFIRVKKGKWIHKKIFVWQEHYGEIPKKMCIRVIDGNTMNTDISNLEMITMKENRIKNSGSTMLSDNYVARLMTRKPPELQEELSKNKDIIELQRTIYQAKRIWKEL